MKNEHFLDASEVAELLSMSKPYAYKLIQSLNKELKAKGYITIRGRISKEFLLKHFYGLEKKK
ncbi:DNA-binding IscR family transcriptional regulator [Breznakia sp. PF5-3]|uniref:hypothetical protein n=1 Tax=unclassified Breznakia TaxID=2623764 RepID=UPI002405DB4C|nr:MULTISPECIES: hypothetical protein [unclassified Breznakia]MDF9825474.1 DNA-binding IscR family transcriptional regulator [Breznakia sp. PM6-1]MDF9836359.1 DNA-binding IscR family transcriptional regulator [Breznakia sp. PF5-3]MDF9838935.1 DNA-binding IscR family transcriptional regulator [Breznakia sp. PFB2-8]MDF9860957.1 DNA-binding IscR family transcriptional regulator [Breznakia sp. PH5-24]